MLSRRQFAATQQVLRLSTAERSRCSFEALQIGKGVCQDYAHVMLSACRLSGLPARYVSGYLYSPNAPEMASHAWVDVFVSETRLALA